MENVFGFKSNVHDVHYFREFLKHLLFMFIVVVFACQLRAHVFLFLKVFPSLYVSVLSSFILYFPKLSVRMLSKQSKVLDSHIYNHNK